MTRASTERYNPAASKIIKEEVGFAELSLSLLLLLLLSTGVHVYMLSYTAYICIYSRRMNGDA